MSKQQKAQKALSALAEQHQWIDRCGGSRTGYIANYGDSGDGGSAIYDADIAELGRREAALIKVLGA